MSPLIINIGLGVAGIIVGLFTAHILLKRKKFVDIEKTEKESEETIEKSKKEAHSITEETKRQADKIKKRLKEEIQSREERIGKIKQSLKHKEETLSKREERINEIKIKIASYNDDVKKTKEAISQIEKEAIEKLSVKTNTSTADLKNTILNKYKSELDEEKSRKLAEAEENLKENAVKKANTILVNTMQRLCSPTSVETRAVIIKVPKDHIKGKIVGKEGKNIEEFEKTLDVAVVFNDLPNTISISAFNLVTRRIAEKAIEKLIRKKGGIDKEVIKRTIKEAEKEIDKELYEVGKNALDKMGIKTDDKELTRTVGRLKYRTSYGQNIMKHSMEVAWIAAMLGSEIGLDANICKEAGFLHDLGKAIDQDPNVKDAHDQLTKELMTKHGFSEEKIHAAWAHHDAVSQETPEALIVKAADAVSGGRPGARQESIEKYMERIQAIDDTVYSFDGVKKSFAMSAGREVRVFIDPEKIQDNKMQEMAKNIAEEIEENVTYPGNIKIKVIRRTKSLEIAK